MAEIFRKRKNLFEKGEWEWIQGPEVLTEVSPSGVERRLPWSDVILVRLVFSPTRSKTWRHYFQVHYRSGDALEIDNVHCKGFGQFEDRSKSYSPFVRSALRLIAEHSPRAEVTLGLTPLVYTAGLAVMFSALGVLAYAVIQLPLSLGSWPVTALVKGLMILAASPAFCFWAVRTRPRRVSLQSIPDSELP